MKYETINIKIKYTIYPSTANITCNTAGINETTTATMIPTIAKTIYATTT
jgi:hypothetical protein